jgi:hypothetical protein
MELGALSDWIDEETLESQIRVVEALAELQEWTTVQLVVPPPARSTPTPIDGGERLCASSRV